MRSPKIERLELRVVPLDSGSPGDNDHGLEIMVGDETLIAMVGHIESQWDAQVAGAYAAASLEYLGMVQEESDGRQTYAGPGVFGGRKNGILLVCDCGHAGCWSLEATVEIKGDVVQWSGFTSTLSKREHGRAYTAIEPLLFDRGAYFKILAELEPQLRALLEARPQVTAY